uniref:Putative ovule protein n=2 Tax=Solanum chacoense TaxID=4108 RepID=A0A0V0GX65_SOLCH
MLLLELSKRVNECGSDLPKVVHFWRIRHECGIIFGVFEQHREKGLLNLPVCRPWNATQFKWQNLVYGRTFNRSVL